jgi:hypothetical protein
LRTNFNPTDLFVSRWLLQDIYCCCCCLFFISVKILLSTDYVQAHVKFVEHRPNLRVSHRRHIYICWVTIFYVQSSFKTFPEFIGIISRSCCMRKNFVL